MKLPERFIIFDTEYTAWQGSMARNWSGLNEFMEIVQIGAILVDRKTMQEIDEWVVFVKPNKNPILSEYFINLTGITQEDVMRRGVDLKTALIAFQEWAKELPCFSFGGDEQVIIKNCKLIGIDFPMKFDKFRNICELFEDNGINTKGYMSSTIVEAFGKKPQKTGHNALNDARSILDGLIELDKLSMI